MFEYKIDFPSESPLEYFGRVLSWNGYRECRFTKKDGDKTLRLWSDDQGRLFGEFRSGATQYGIYVLKGRKLDKFLSLYEFVPESYWMFNAKDDSCECWRHLAADSVVIGPSKENP